MQTQTATSPQRVSSSHTAGMRAHQAGAHAGASSHYMNVFLGHPQVQPKVNTGHCFMASATQTNNALAMPLQGQR